jgi:hypothetical protein
MQESVLFVMGDLLGVIQDCIQRTICVSVRLVGWWCRTKRRQRQVKQAEMEDVVW